MLNVSIEQAPQAALDGEWLVQAVCIRCAD